MKFKESHYYRFTTPSYNEVCLIHYFKYKEDTSIIKENKDDTSHLHSYYHIVLNRTQIYYYENDDIGGYYSYDNKSSNLYSEIEFKDIVDYLPDNNIDKIVYLRKRNIKLLLDI